MVVRGWIVAVSFFALSLLLISCGDKSVTSPDKPAPQLSRTDYFYHPGNYNYQSWEAGLSYTHDLTASLNGSILTLSGSHGKPGSQDPNQSFEFLFTPEGIVLGGVQQDALFQLPQQYLLVDSTVFIPNETAKITNILAYNATTAFAGSEEEGVYRYNAMSNTWVPSGMQGHGAVTKIVKDSTLRMPELFAATDGDGIYRSTDGGLTWNPVPGTPPGKVDDISTGPEGILLAAIEGGLYSIFSNTSQWYVATMATPSPYALSISAVLGPSSVGLVQIGTKSAGIFTGFYHRTRFLDFPPDYWLENAAATPGFVYQQEYDPVLCVSGSAPFQTMGFTRGPQKALCVYVDDPANEGWGVVPYNFPEAAINDFCYLPYDGTVFIATPNGLRSARVTGTAPSIAEWNSTLDGKNVLDVEYLADDKLMAVTDEMIYTSSDRGITWVPAVNGLNFQSVSGELVLLPDAFSIGENWEAGEVLLQRGATEVLYGRVIDHFDELRIRDDYGNYPDVAVVNYSFEQASDPTVRDSYLLRIYYAKGIGPVLIEEFENGVMTRETILLPNTGA
ncbi:MAG: hypothetical protein CL946_02355 [Ectothiorhodospiraceae bacterium]|nr:hypothetical protein [Ectothiorhodospiraceae bacterium]